MRADPIEIEEEERQYKAPVSVVGRLREYSRYRHWPKPNAWPPESPLYAVLRAPGRATNGAQDGGMAAKMDQMGYSIAQSASVLETRSAVLLLPESLLAVIRAMYEVPPNSDTRSDRTVATMLSLSRLEVIRRLERAYGWLSREMCIPPH